MSEPTQPNEDHEPQHALDEPVETVETTGGDEPVTVEQLQESEAQAREQLAEASTRGDQLYQMLHLRSMEQAAGDLLQALDHMPEDDPRYRDDSGMPSITGMREVAQELIDARPYLAKASGSIHQGVNDSPTVPDFGDLLRGVLG